MTTALSASFLSSTDFWIGVGVLAGIYGIFTVGLQLNVGFTGIFNFGQAGFMAVGAYTAGGLVVHTGWPLWAAVPAGMLAAMAAGLLIGLPSLRLRADYFAITTIAFSEIIRLIAQNARGITGGNQGLLGFDGAWVDVSNRMSDWFSSIGLGNNVLLPLLVLTWAGFLVIIALMRLLTDSPWGRVLRAIREDEDAALALGKNTFSYKLQSLAIAAALGALGGYLLAFYLAFLVPNSFEPTFTFIGYTILILGGMASYTGVAIGGIILWTILEGTRYLDIGLSSEQIAALRFMIVGLMLILLVAFRPQGILGKREEMVLSE